MNGKTPTVADLILRAAAELGGTFTLTELVVACWKLSPDVFCLEGRVQYPDNNKVIAALCGRRGLVARGWLVKKGPKLYAVPATADPVSLRSNYDGETQIVRQVKRLSTYQILPDRQRHLVDLIIDRDTVFKRYIAGKTLTDDDALAFWGKPQFSLTRGDLLNNRISQMRLETLVEKKEFPPIGQQEINNLKHLTTLMEDRSKITV